MYELALFAGAGGGILGAMLCGHTIVGAVEIEKYPREVLKQRQRDGILDKFPIWDDVCTFREENPECREYIEMLKGIRENLVISGGFPCQDISAAGKGAGISEGTRSGLWFEMFRIIGEIRPTHVFIENSPMLTFRGGTRVIADLASLGYDARWGVIGANAVGMCHPRERLWILAFNSDKIRRNAAQIQSKIIDPEESCRRQFARAISTLIPESAHPRYIKDSNELAKWVDRSSSIGNGQVPAVVKLAWEILGDK